MESRGESMESRGSQLEAVPPLFGTGTSVIQFLLAQSCPGYGAYCYGRFLQKDRTPGVPQLCCHSYCPTWGRNQIAQSSLLGTRNTWMSAISLDDR
ncbi:hypothetical protein STEG23_015083 [Scotinomys teguina]